MVLRVDQPFIASIGPLCSAYPMSRFSFRPSTRGEGRCEEEQKEEEEEEGEEEHWDDWGRTGGI